jgi:CheY-like chemotaxis protein
MAKIAVVGHCAAGKSTVVHLLRGRGHDAIAVAQEHSAIRDLWNHQQPDVILYLEVSLEELRRRKNNPKWPAWIFETQESRLQDARAHASLEIDTDIHDADAVVEFLEQHLAARAAAGQ